MGTIADYTGGFILESIRKVLHYFDSSEGVLTHDEKGQRLHKNIHEFEPLVLSFDQAGEYIREAKSLAIGERVCRVLHPEAGSTESVFSKKLLRLKYSTPFSEGYILMRLPSYASC